MLYLSASEVEFMKRRYIKCTYLYLLLFNSYNSETVTVIFQVFYLPMAFFIPASMFVVHIQFSLLYQFWIHTAVLHNIIVSLSLSLSPF